MKEQEPEQTYSNTTGISQAGQGSGADRVHNPGAIVRSVLVGAALDTLRLESLYAPVYFVRAQMSEAYSEVPQADPVDTATPAPG